MSKYAGVRSIVIAVIVTAVVTVLLMPDTKTIRTEVALPCPTAEPPAPCPTAAPPVRCPNAVPCPTTAPCPAAAAPAAPAVACPTCRENLDVYAHQLGKAPLPEDPSRFVWPPTPKYRDLSINWPLVISRCRTRILGQGMQDGILLCIFAAINTTNRFFVEFGHTSIFEANSGLLHFLGWRGLFLDGAPPDARQEYNLQSARLSPDNICELFTKYQVPKSFDYLSADLDSIEFYVVNAIFRCGYRPRVFSIEYNCHVPLDKKWTLKLTDQWNGGCYYGLSLGAAVALAEAWGYALIAVDVALDAFFVDKALIAPGVVLPPLSNFEPHLCLTRPLHACPPGGASLSQGWAEVTPALLAEIGAGKLK